MNLFGLEPYLGALVIACIGITGSVLLGWLSKKKNTFDVKKVVASVIIGFPAALIIVSTELQIMVLPEDGGLTAAIVVAGLIMQVAGIDFVIKTANKARNPT